MVDKYTLINFLDDVGAIFVEIDGYVFVERDHDGEKTLRGKLSQYQTLADAQNWVNIVDFRDYLDDIVGSDWEINDKGIDNILLSIKRIWKNNMPLVIKSMGVYVEIWKDESTGDVGLILKQRK